MKINFLRPLTTCFLFSMGVVCYGDTLPYPFKILPQPQSVQLSTEAGLQSGSLQKLIMKGNFKAPVMGSLLSHLPVGKESGKGTVTLTLDKKITALHSEEGYQLTITKDRVEIVAPGEAG